MVWDLDKLEEAYQASKQARALTSFPQKQLPESTCTTIAPFSLESLITDRAETTIEVLPKSVGEEALKRAEELGLKDFMLNRVAILDFKIDFSDGSSIHIPSYHEQWKGSYEEYTEHITQVVRNLRREGYKINYRYFDRNLQRFVYTNGTTLEDYPRNIGSPQRKNYEKLADVKPREISGHLQ